MDTKNKQGKRKMCTANTLFDGVIACVCFVFLLAWSCICIAMCPMHKIIGPEQKCYNCMGHITKYIKRIVDWN